MPHAFRSLLRRSIQGILVVAVVCLLSAIAPCAVAGAGGVDDGVAVTSTDFSFVSQALTLSGIITQPAQGKPRALIVFIHGYGKTDVRGWNMYADLRSRFASLGIASATWDKPGEGRSEGPFDVNQPVASSAQEVLDAIAYLRSQKIPGADRIGLWGISRAGWIAPIVLSQDPKIRFWISVSGVTAEDNYFYLLKSNLPYEGSTVEEAEELMEAWKHGFELFRTGASYEDYNAATRKLRNNAYLSRMSGAEPTRESYEREQAKLRSAVGPLPFERETGMSIYIQNFDAMLSKLNVAVLALFGEKDLNVDWRRTRAFYVATLGRNPNASLTVRTFPAGNHNLDVCETGSMREMQTMTTRRKSAGYYETQLEWLRKYVLADPSS